MTGNPDLPTDIGDRTVRISTDHGELVDLPFRSGDSLTQLGKLGIEWTYTLRSRSRWLANNRYRESLDAHARRTLQSIGITDDHIASLRRARIIEVGIRYKCEELNWESRIFPWEYLFNAAARAQDSEHPPTIVFRYLERDQPITGSPATDTEINPSIAGSVESETDSPPIGNRPAAKEPSRQSRILSLVVTSAPGRLAREFDFSREHAIVSGALAAGSTGRLLDGRRNPSLSDLRDVIETNSPDVIHLGGIDAHRGAEALGLGTDPHRRDGIYLRDEKNGLELLVGHRELGSTLVAGEDSKPQLVVINAFNSGSRLAAMPVANGAGAAIGFQDIVDDTLAEAFVVDFYRAWLQSSKETWGAFEFAWSRLISQPRRFRPGGIVLWSSKSILEQPGYDEQRSLQIRNELTVDRRKRFKASAKKPLADVLEVQYEPPEHINYARLHNNGDIFEQFRLVKTVPECVDGLDIEVRLQLGAEHATYLSTMDVDQDAMFLEDKIRLPMTWAYVRDLTDSLRSSLYVNVSRNGETIHRNTHSVLLQPIQEWRDDESSFPWLPSFVRPRDAEIDRIIGRARKNLQILAETPEAGFCGYGQAASDGVYAQVRAIWSTLVYEYDLTYISPLPNYVYGTQRLRTPSQIISSSAGTCVDLATLFAACLEYVEIYPVLFLVSGHVLTGFWTSRKHYEGFYFAMSEVSLKQLEDAAGSKWGFDMSSGDKEWWLAGDAAYEDVILQILAGKLVPVESAAITTKHSLTDAIELGQTVLMPPIESPVRKEEVPRFEAMIDVQLARSNYGVTPLPI